MRTGLSTTDRMGQRHGARPRAASAFTMVEVVIVLSLMALLAALVWPSLDSYLRSAQLPESTDNVRAMLRMARASACDLGRRYRIRFEPKEQQPRIEIETDPMYQPNVWTPCTDAWAREPMLLGEVQVVEIVAGRPDYLTPVSHTMGEASEDEFGPKDQGFGEGIFHDDSETAAFGTGSSHEDGTKDDPHRATIVFDIDGHSDWYTIKLAKSPSGEPVPRDVQQAWVLLDGRTGLPNVQEPMTDEQLADASLRPDLDKLQPPEPPPEEMADADSNGVGSAEGANGANPMAGLEALGQQFGQANMPGGAPGGEGPMAEGQQNPGMGEQGDGGAKKDDGMSGQPPADQNTNGQNGVGRRGGGRTNRTPRTGGNSGNGGNGGNRGG